MVRKEITHSIKASEFKAKCLALMDDVAISGETWVGTKNGRPIAELRPYSGGRIATPFGLHPALEIHGDVISPLGDDLWKAME
ncbi:type II toxin-antitoxin system Phd/YefM family antitoxin [Spiribacter onubensis]|uniref:Type II toxin-antitoxin system Phd/YefM family antitoxin n=1 Tax=Spiribacter onubensis TaxID=3122420 RepID=A0ABV3SAG7_9GAMM